MTEEKTHMNQVVITNKYLSFLSVNSVKLQNAKLMCINLLDFYTVTTKYQKEKLRKQPHLSCIKRIKCLRINLPKEVKDP